MLCSASMNWCYMWGLTCCVNNEAGGMVNLRCSFFCILILLVGVVMLLECFLFFFLIYVSYKKLAPRE